MENLFAWKKNPEKERRGKVRDRLALYNIEARIQSYERRSRRRPPDPEFEFARMKVQHVLESSTLTSDKDIAEALEAIDTINGTLAVAGVPLEIPAQDLEGPIEAPDGEIEALDFAHAIHDPKLQQSGEDLEESKAEYYALYRRFRVGEVELTPARKDLLNKAAHDVRESIEHFAATYRALMEKRHPGVSYRAQEQALIESAHALTPTLAVPAEDSLASRWLSKEFALPATRSGPAVEMVRKQEPGRMQEYARAVLTALILFAAGFQVAKHEEPPAQAAAERFEPAPAAPELRAFTQEAPPEEVQPADMAQEDPLPETNEPHPAQVGGPLAEDLVEPGETVATNVHGRRI